MIRLLVLVALVAVLAGLLLSELTHTGTSIANASIPDNEVATTVGVAGNTDSATATITITMTPVCLPDE